MLGSAFASAAMTRSKGTATQRPLGGHSPETVAAWLWLRGGCQGEASAEACGPATNGRWPVTASRAASGALVEETVGGTLLCSSRPWDHTPHDAEVRVGIVWWDK